jgi:hypothetical protein
VAETDYGYELLPAGTTEAVIRNVFPEPSPYQEDPAGWIESRLGAHLWSKQKEICQSVVENRYTGVKACHGPGKSYSAARIVTWWLDPEVHELGSAFAVTTAPSWPQVQAILWREMRRAHRKAKLPGRITLDCHWYMGEGRSDEELIAMGRKPADYDEQAFQGIHAEHILVVLDEASGIPPSLWVAVETLMTNEHARLLAIGNPDDPSSDFAKKCKRWEKDDGCDVIRISAFDSPNFTGEYVPDDVARALVTPMWVEDRRQDWGEDSMLWTSRVEGEFPDLSDDYLITPAMLSRAYSVELPGLETGKYALDVARMGADKSELYRNRGGVIRHVKSWAKKSTMETANLAALELDRHKHVTVPIVVDGIGVGAGVYDRLFERGYEAGMFISSHKPLNPVKFYNRRSEVYWLFREGLEHGQFDLDETDEELAAQLMSIKFWINGRGQIQLETKEDMKERALPSPDKADAVVMSTVHIGMVQWTADEDQAYSMTSDLLTKVM